LERRRTMISDLGTTLLFTAFMLSLMQAGLVCAKRSQMYSALLPALAIGGFVTVSVAFAILIYGFAISDFSLSIVYLNSHTLKPMLYKLSGAWGNHEGSILLWCWVLTFYSAVMTLYRDRDMSLAVTAHALHVMGGVQTVFLAYTLWTSSPFTALFPVPNEGLGLNPLLQDIGLAMHPPLLYLGYVGFAAVFSLSIAGLVTGNITPHFARALHPWILFPWTCLTVGIALGSWWAYRELGWGGWWFWDPVENASLLPWLTATALFHANIVMKKRGNFQRWVLLLALITFILSMLGTFLVRSGIITSVHSFASDPTRGYAVLLILTCIAGYGLYAYIRYGEVLPRSNPIALFSREAAVLVNNFLLVISMIGILLAMIYPLIIEGFTGRMLTIGTGYYNGVFTALMIPMLAVCAMGTFLVWEHKPRARQTRHSLECFVMAMLVGGGVNFWLQGSWLCAVGLIVGGWVLLATAFRAFQLRSNHAALQSLAGMFIAHGGLAIFTLAATLYGALHTQSEFVMKVGETKQANGYTLTLERITHGEGENYVYRRGLLTVSKGRYVTQLSPEERFYPVEEQFTTEAVIGSFLFHDDYATMKRVLTIPDETPKLPQSTNKTVMKERQEATEKVVIQFHRNPAMSWLWAGAALMVLSGGIVTLQHYRGRRSV
jgi:cytochrome c-type biogenesis protein CcmF